MGFLGILEQVLLNESASIENVTRAMDNNSKVIINYRSNGEDNHTGVRIIEPVAYGLTKSGNPVIRAWQPYGDTTTKTPGWKFFRLDRISYWEETGVKFGDVPDFKDKGLNPDGDNSMSTVIKTYNSTKRNDATNGVNIGPKTKEKVLANTEPKEPELFKTQGDKSVDIAKKNVQRMLGTKPNVKPEIFRTQGDERLALGKSNLERMKGGITIDVDNNLKADNGVNQFGTQQTQSTGPKLQGGIASNDNNINGSVENGDIDKQELDMARQMVNEPEPEIFRTQGDEQLTLGKSNLERMKGGFSNKL